MAGIERTVSALPKGTALARYCMALGASPKDTSKRIEIAERHWRNTPQVAATLKAAVDAGGINTETWGTALALYGVGLELIEALRPAVIVDQIAPFMRKVPFRVRIARQTTQLGGNWVGEQQPIAIDASSYDVAVQENYKAQLVVVFTKEVLQFSNPSAEADLRGQLVASIARFLDRQFLDPSVAPVLGLRPGAVTHHALAVASTGSDGDSKLAGFAAMIDALVNANTPMLAPYWIMRPSTAINLAITQSSGGHLLFPDIRANGGMLLGIPVLTSNSSLEQITLIDASQLLLSDDGNVDLAGTEEAALEMSTDVGGSPATHMTSLWQRNLFGLRFTREIAWQPLHNDGGSPERTAGVCYMNVTY